MSGEKDKGAEQVDPKPDRQQTSEEIESYWTPERRGGAKPIPLPSVDPATRKRTPHPPPSDVEEEKVVEPTGPDN